MNPNEGLGLLGWVCLAAVALGVVMTLLFGFTSTFYIAILLVPVVFVALLLLCRGAGACLTGSFSRRAQEEYLPARAIHRR